MKREELRNKLTDILSAAMSGGINFTQAERSIWDLFNPGLPPAEGAEEVAQRCPVCGGNGLVPNGFYLQTGGTWLSSSLAPETCRACNGTGVILPSYLHAQKMAEKMVEEKLREELIAYDKYIGAKGWIDNYKDETAEPTVDEYLKSREK